MNTIGRLTLMAAMAGLAMTATQAPAMAHATPHAHAAHIAHPRDYINGGQQIWMDTDTGYAGDYFQVWIYAHCSRVTVLFDGYQFLTPLSPDTMFAYGGYSGSPPPGSNVGGPPSGDNGGTSAGNSGNGNAGAGSNDYARRVGQYTQGDRWWQASGILQVPYDADAGDHQLTLVCHGPTHSHRFTVDFYVESDYSSYGGNGNSYGQGNGNGQ